MAFNDGVCVTEMGFGTWAWGNQLLWGYNPTTDDDALAATFLQAVDGGLQFIDTADSYGTGRLNGRSESLLGRFLGMLSPGHLRSLTVATKLAPFPWRLGRRGFDRAFQASQNRLCGHLKRIQLHWSTARYAPWQEDPLVDGLADLVMAGAVQELGVSNVGPRRLRQIHDRLERSGVKLKSLQAQLSLLAPDPLKILVPICRELNIDLIAYSPLSLGVLTVAPGEEENFLKRARMTSLRRRLFYRLLPGSLELRRAMIQIAEGQDASMAEVALNWCRAHGACPIPGIRQPEQARHVVSALSWQLDNQERARLDRLSQDCAVQMPANPFQSS